MTQALSTDVKGGALASGYNVEQLATVKAQVAPKASNAQFSYFMGFCEAHGFNPFTKQAYCIVREVQDPNNRNGPRIPQATIQIGIDGLRMLAEKSELYEGQTEPQWCGRDGNWRDIWTEDDPPFAARVGIHRAGWREAVYGIAKYSEFVQMVDKWEGYGENRRKVGSAPNEMWAKMPANQLAKCAEAQALRKAFPQVLKQLSDSLTNAGASGFTVEVGAAPPPELAPEAQPPIEAPKRKSSRSKASEVTATPTPRDDVDRTTGEILEGEVLSAAEAASEAPAPAQAVSGAKSDGTPMGPDDWTVFWTAIKDLGLKRGEVLAAAGAADITDWSQEQIAALVEILRGTRMDI